MNKKSILEKMGFAQLNSMQSKAYEAISQDNRDVILLSPTGTGKTLAYLLPLVEMLDMSSAATQVLVIVPTRELAQQSAKFLDRMGTTIRSMACYGGRTAMEEHRVMRQTSPQVIFATPGRLLDHLDKSNLVVDTVRFLVIDEFDKCLEMGFHEEMTAIMNQLSFVHRRILLSATQAMEMNYFVDESTALILSHLSDQEEVSSRITVSVVLSETKDKLKTLYHLLCSLGTGSSIVFVGFRDSVNRITDYLNERGFVAIGYHGGLEQKERDSAIYKFSNGSANVLVSTDLASRGLDIPIISNIIHYHLPESEDNYTHRVGRSARWDATGHSMFILAPNESLPEYIHPEPQHLSVNMDEKTVPLPPMITVYVGKGKKDKISKGDIVGLFCKKGKLKSSEIGQIDIKERYSYIAVSREVAAQLLNNLAGEKIKGIKTVFELV
ncbi:MAG: DEAD/DEAH box helicase [Prevotella sp.]